MVVRKDDSMLLDQVATYEKAIMQKQINKDLFSKLKGQINIRAFGNPLINKMHSNPTPMINIMNEMDEIMPISSELPTPMRENKPQLDLNF